MKKKFFMSFLFLVTILATSVFALSDAEYKKMMKNPEFARADKRLNQTWKKVSKSLKGSALDRLKQNQREWINTGRDASAEEFMGDYSRVEAYTIATNLRADELPTLAKSLAASPSKKSFQGTYTRRDRDGGSSDLEVRLLNSKTSEVEVSFSAVSDSGSTSEWSGRGKIKNGVLEIYDEEAEGYATLNFNGDKVEVETDGLDGYLGMGVTLDGTYFKE